MKKKRRMIIYYFSILLILMCNPSKEEIERAKNKLREFYEILNTKINKIEIYCNYSDKTKLNSKVTITDPKVINLIIKSSKNIFKKKASGHFADYYLIRITTRDRQSYAFLFNKEFTEKEPLSNDKCREYIIIENKKIDNPYNDCGQIILLENPNISEEEHIYNTIPRGYYYFHNIDLIPIMKKYADDVSFNSKSKKRFYYYYELREMNKLDKKKYWKYRRF